MKIVEAVLLIENRKDGNRMKIYNTLTKKKEEIAFFTISSLPSSIFIRFMNSTFL